MSSSTADTQPLNIGLIGLDTSHVVAFAKLLMNADDPHHVGGARITCAFPGGSPDFALSSDRVPGFTQQLRDEFGVTILDSIEGVAEQADLVFLESVDGRVHREQFARIASFGKPVFIDKPLATSLADARAIVELGERAGVPVMSSSSLRYADAFRTALGDDSKGALVGVDAFGPMALQPTQPGYFWYGIHGIEMLVAALGPDCRRVRVHVTEGADLLTAEWADGRTASFRGLRNAHSGFGLTLHREKGFQQVDIATGRAPFYASLLQAILASLPQGRSDVSAKEMLTVVSLIEAANQSRTTGEFVSLA